MHIWKKQATLKETEKSTVDIWKYKHLEFKMLIPIYGHKVKLLSDSHIFALKV